MKKFLVVFLAIVIIGAGIGFGATSTLYTNELGDTNDNLGQNNGIPSINTAQNDGNSIDSIDQANGNSLDSVDQANGNSYQDGNDLSNDVQDNWYDGFWNSEGNNNGFWTSGDNYDKKDDKDRDKDRDHKKDKDKKDKDNNDKVSVTVNNYVTSTTTGGNAQTTGGNSESNVETKTASSNVPQQIASEISESNGGNIFVNAVPMQKTGLPIIPALMSTLLICSGLLYRKLRK